MNESYRAIRTSLLLSQAEKAPQVILLTSPSPGEGKTATSLNLAISLAQDGRAVLLIDGDMRKGTCHRRLGLRNHRGLSNVLTGGLSLEEGVQPTPVNGLSLLSCGVTPPNPGELLGSRKMSEVMRELREQYEFILIDSPPMIAISDAAILSIITDGVILVLNGKTTSTAYAQKAVERLDMVRARLLGVVLNSVNLDNPNYSYFRVYSTYYEGSNETAVMRLPQVNVMTENVDAVAQLGKVLAGLESKTQVINSEAGKNGYTSKSSVGKSDRVVSHSAQPRSLEKPLTRGAIDSDTLLPRGFMPRLIQIFMESIGPIAPLVVRDHVARLGESYDAFPMRRIDELIKLIAAEIFDRELRSKFQKNISEEIHNFSREA